MSDPDVLQTEPRLIILSAYGADVREWTFRVSDVPQPPRTGRTKIFPTRATLGPPNPSVDDTLSLLNYEDLSAGQGVYRINPSSDLSHTWWHTAVVEGTDGWTGARETIAARPASFTGTCVPVGKIGQSAYALWGTALHGWDPDALTWGAAQQTVGSVVNSEGIATFNGKMYFPLGSSGYARIGEASTGTLAAVESIAGAATPTYAADTVPTSNPRVWAFCTHRNMLWALTTSAEGYALCNSLTGDSNDWYWPVDTSRRTFIKVETSFAPKTLAVFPNALSNLALWVSGRGGLLVYDTNEYAWEPSNLIDVPPHPDFGRAMKPFRPGEALWIAGGGGDVIQYTAGGNVVPASGPGGGNQGMPADKRGSAVSFASDLAHLYGLFQGDQTVTATPSIVEDSETADPLYIPGAVASSTVIAWTGKGWHPVWENAGSGVPTKIVVADALKDDGSVDYRAFWGQGEDCWSMTCRLTTHSSRQAISAGTGERFATTSIDAPDRAGYIEWGEFDGGSSDIRKLVSHVAIHMDLASSLDYVEFQYTTSDSATNSWVSLGAATQDAADNADHNPRTVLPFGITSDGLFSEGMSCYWLRARLRWVTTTATTPAIVRNISLAFMPLPQDAAVKTYSVPLPIDVDHATGMTAEQIVRKLESLVSSERFLFLQDGQTKFRAYVSSVSYSLGSSPDTPGALGLTVLQIPSGLPTLTGDA